MSSAPVPFRGHRCLVLHMAFPLAPAVLVENEYLAQEALGSVFHTPEFFRLHASDATGSYCQWVRSGAVVGCVHFSHTGNGLWRSPARGTFAGWVWTPDLPLEELVRFHDAVETRLAERGAQQLEVLPAPMAYGPEAFSVAVFLLQSRKYFVNGCDLNQSMEIDERPLTQRMSRNNLKRFRKCEREGLVTSRLPTEFLPQVYQTLAANRASDGRALSMTIEQLRVMTKTFPDAVLLFGCHHGEVLAAAAICLRLDESKLYVFYWGHLPQYGPLSPVVSVAEEIYRFCQAQGVRLLDAGTSTLEGSPNLGLLRFKHGLGFSDSLKIRAIKTCG